ncbi:DUF3558 domain-containing protein [Nocardia sp. NPDC050718]|uniref:DUF3558 domain-containing protein n=1 Tax=Nocardia sp. NPDC050718 TaxID=3155788 RepID=UPI0033DDC74A
MRGVVVVRAVACGLAGVAVLAGCGDGEQGAGGPTKAAVEVFNPCRGDLSDEVLRNAGLDPATKRVTTDPPTGASAWRICNWAPLDDRAEIGKRRVAVISTSNTLAQARTKDSLVNVRDTSVNARPGLVSQEKNDPNSCYVSFEAEQGMFEIKVGWLSTEGPRVGDTCEMAATFAAALEPKLPK